MVLDSAQKALAVVMNARHKMSRLGACRGSGGNREPGLAPKRLMICLALVFCFLGCGRTDVGESGSASRVKLVLSGSSTVGPLAAEIGKRYEKENPSIRVDVQTGGSSLGIREASTGLADIGMSSRALKESENAEAKEWPIAMDGVCFIVHGDNTVGELTEEQLAGVMRGEIKDWKDLGGEPGAIFFVNRTAGRSELELVTKFFGIKEVDMKPDLVAGENQQGIQNVASTPGSISYMSVGASEEAIRFGTKIRMLPLKGIAATVANVESGSFPLSRPLVLVTKHEPTGAAKQFIEYAQSDAVSDLVRELSYVPIEN